MSSYQVTVIVLFGTAFLVAAAHRTRAQVERGRVSEVEENRVLYVLLRGGGLVLWGSMIAYAINPAWLQWAELPLPAWLRWGGSAIAALAIPLAGWAALSIGANVTRTVVTRESHQLVTWGPYRAIRHPLYTSGIMMFGGLGLLAASALILALTGVAWVLVTLRLPQEEAHLIARFGDDYQNYMARTGRYLPRFN